MSRSSRYDLVVIGGGTAGLVASQAAAALGARVALVERDRIGGECLHTGCVPSKALLAAAERVHAMRTAYRVGIEAHQPEVDFVRVMGHVHDAIAAAGAEDTPEHLRSAGVEVVLAEARFLGPGEIAAGGRPLRYRAALIATGSKPAIPAIKGLRDADPLTNETVFELDGLPRRLIPLVFSMTSGMPRDLAAASISRISGWIEGSPPESCTDSGSPSAATKASSIDSTWDRLSEKPCPRMPVPESAKQIGQSRLQAVFTSMIPRQVCCACSGQIPQSWGQPASTAVWRWRGSEPGLLNRWISR